MLERNIKQFMSAPLVAFPSVPCDDASQCSAQTTPLDILQLPSHMKQTIWTRAISLKMDEPAIVKAPDDESAFIVKSLSGQRPHYVNPSKVGGWYLCDDQCLSYKSSKMCAHISSASSLPSSVPTQNLSSQVVASASVMQPSRNSSRTGTLLLPSASAVNSHSRPQQETPLPHADLQSQFNPLQFTTQVPSTQPPIQ